MVSLSGVKGSSFVEITSDLLSFVGRHADAQSHQSTARVSHRCGDDEGTEYKGQHPRVRTRQPLALLVENKPACHGPDNDTGGGGRRRP
jgi:hypothetical protein